MLLSAQKSNNKVFLLQQYRGSVAARGVEVGEGQRAGSQKLEEWGVNGARYVLQAVGTRSTKITAFSFFLLFSHLMNTSLMVLQHLFISKCQPTHSTHKWSPLFVFHSHVRRQILLQSKCTITHFASKQSPILMHCRNMPFQIALHPKSKSTTIAHVSPFHLLLLLPVPPTTRLHDRCRRPHPTAATPSLQASPSHNRRSGFLLSSHSAPILPSLSHLDIPPFPSNRRIFPHTTSMPPPFTPSNTPSRHRRRSHVLIQQICHLHPLPRFPSLPSTPAPILTTRLTSVATSSPATLSLHINTPPPQCPFHIYRTYFTSIPSLKHPLHFPLVFYRPHIAIATSYYPPLKTSPSTPHY